MAEFEWQEAVVLLNEDFPILPADADFPSLSAALDDGVDDLLRDTPFQPSPANPRYVEDLLHDCVNRISNCLLLRDKAQEVEVRAIGEALNYKAQTASVAAHELINRFLGTMAPRMAQNAIGAKLEDTAVTFQGDEAAWGQIGGAQAGLYKELREILAIQKAKATTPGNGSNFVERFAFLKRFFDICLVEAFRRAQVCAKALKDVYGIDARLPAITPVGYLNELSIWAQRASDALDDMLDARLFSDIAFAIAAPDDSPRDYELTTKSKFGAEIPTGRLTFKLTSAHFERAHMRNPLLRSLRLQVRKDDPRLRLWPAQVILPRSQVTGTTEIFPCIAPSSYQDTPDEDVVVRGVHNISPIGDWEIKLADRALTGDALAVSEVTNVYLFLRLSYLKL